MHARNQFPYDCIKVLGTIHEGLPSTLGPKCRQNMRGCMYLLLWIISKCGQGRRGLKMLRMFFMSGPLDNRCASVAASSFMPTWRRGWICSEMKRKRRSGGRCQSDCQQLYFRIRHYAGKRVYSALGCRPIDGRAGASMQVLLD